MASEEDVPPLEDMSELIQQVDALRELKQAQKPGSRKADLQNGHGATRTSSQTQSVKPKSTNHASNAPNTTDPVTKKAAVKQIVEENPKVCNSLSESAAKSSSSPACNSKQTSSGFGGMKKGFLFGGPPKQKTPANKLKSESVEASGSKSESVVKKSASTTKPTLEEIPFVRKNENAENKNFQFSEVQEAMTKTNEKLMQNKDWVTDDLLNKLEKNEKLAKRLQDPRFIQAIGDFQKNPQEAMVKYGQSPDIQEFFKEFCGLMGEHFNKLGDKQQPESHTPPPAQATPVVTAPPTGGADMSVRSSTNPKQATSQDEAKMQQILSDPEIRLILMDPKIQTLFETLRNNPENTQRILQSATGDLKGKIHKLVQVGLLQFQS